MLKLLYIGFIFGERLGVSRSVINNIERNALARPDQKLSLIKLICKEFSVNEDWLLNGNKPMFVESDTFSLDEFLKQRGATNLELQIVKTYFDLDPDTRKMLVDHFRKGLSTSVSTAIKEEREKMIGELKQGYKKMGLNSDSKKDSKERPTATNDNLAELSMTVEETEAAYIKSRSKSVQKTVQSASNIFADTIKNPEKNINVKVSNQ